MTKGGERYLSDPVYRARIDAAIAELDERMASDEPGEVLTADELRERCRELRERYRVPKPETP